MADSWAFTISRYQTRAQRARKGVVAVLAADLRRLLAERALLAAACNRLEEDAERLRDELLAHEKHIAVSLPKLFKETA